MGCCASAEVDQQVEIKGENPLVLTKELTSFIKKINGLLQVALPECQRIVNSKDEAGMFHQISLVLDQVIAHHHEELNPPQRRELLKRCVPPNQPKFREVVEKQKEFKHFVSSRPDVDLVRMIHLWFEADQDNSGELEVEEVRHLLTMMNIQVSGSGLKELVAAMDASGDGIIQFDEFFNMYTSLTTLQPISDLFYQISTRPHNEEVYAFYDLERFLRSKQKTRFRAKDAQHCITSVFGEMRLIEGVMGISRRQFQNALLDASRNSWLDTKEKRVHQDMTQPLAHYFIDSSHNTYLSGNQLNSDSSVDMYIMCLRQGCRCVEIDCWDGPNNDPIVYHGHTMTSKIRFYDVIVAIDKSAFATSPYPIILSLEVHTCPAQQNVMAQIMREIFGAKLLSAIDAENTNLASKEFTPAGLLRKVLVKAKKEVISKEQVERGELGEEMGEALSELSYLQSKKFTSLPAAQRFPHYSIVSVDEKRMEAWAKQPELFGELNKKCFTRTYPKGTRVDSSNYHPQAGWNIGAQVVALNYQTMDFPMRLNRAKFLVNGGCGYVLKPRALRMKGVSPSSFGDRKKLAVKIVSGFQLPKPRKPSRNAEIIDPYVQVFITGIQGDDTSALPAETRVIDNNGVTPTWNETFHFNLNSVEMAIVTLRVMQKDTMQDSFIGEASCPVSGLRMGYRCVALVNELGQPIPAPTVLFCHFALTSKQVIDAEDL